MVTTGYEKKTQATPDFSQINTVVTLPSLARDTGVFWLGAGSCFRPTMASPAGDGTYVSAPAWNFCAAYLRTLSVSSQPTTGGTVMSRLSGWKLQTSGGAGIGFDNRLQLKLDFSLVGLNSSEHGISKTVGWGSLGAGIEFIFP